MDSKWYSNGYINRYKIGGMKVTLDNFYWGDWHSEIIGKEQLNETGMCITFELVSQTVSRNTHAKRGF